MEPVEENCTAEQILERLPMLAHTPGLVAPLKNIFQYTQFLLDEEENLTRTGNLNSEARKLLHQRIFEVLDIATSNQPTDQNSVQPLEQPEASQ